MYNVLKIVYREDGYDVKGNKNYAVSWQVVGKANSMQEARKFMPYPVLEEVK